MPIRKLIMTASNHTTWSWKCPGRKHCDRKSGRSLDMLKSWARLTSLLRVTSQWSTSDACNLGHYPTHHIRDFLSINSKGGTQILQLIVINHLCPIYELDGKEFWNAFWQCIAHSLLGLLTSTDIISLGHHQLWVNGIHHGDISYNNPMYNASTKTNKPVGIVNNFDLATWLEANTPVPNLGGVSAMRCHDWPCQLDTTAVSDPCSGPFSVPSISTTPSQLSPTFPLSLCPCVSCQQSHSYFCNIQLHHGPISFDNNDAYFLHLPPHFQQCPITLPLTSYCL